MMAALPYALSVHHFISRVGDYVGFAAIIAVAIMVLLLFAHARETAELRRRAEYAEDELSVLHERVEWLRGAQRTGGVPQAGGTPGVTPAPAAAGASGVPAVPPPAAVGARSGHGPRSGVPAGTAALATGTASATSAGGDGPVAPVPAPASAARRTVVLGAPVGAGAPALSSATKLIPPTDEELRAVAAGAGAAAATSEPALLAAGSAGYDDSGAAVIAPPAPPPATVAAGGNGAPPPSRRTGIAADPGAPRGAGRPGQPGGVTSPRRNYGAETKRSGRRRISRTLIVALTLLVVAIAVVAVIVLHDRSNKTHHSTAVSNQSVSVGHKGKGSGKQGKAGRVTVNVDPATVTVAVLNGTTTANLAAAVSAKLSAKGFQQGTTADAADQSMPTTIVGYVPSANGAKNDAYAVAHTLGLKQTAVKPVSAANQSVACMNDPTSCPDQVIVTVGADLNSDAT